MNVKYEKKPEMTFIGYHTEIRPEEGYQKCPEFWDKEFAAKYARLWQTMKPETEIEKAILENEIGMFAICSESESQGDPQASDYECGIWVPVQAEGRL